MDTVEILPSNYIFNDKMTRSYHNKIMEAWFDDYVKNNDFDSLKDLYEKCGCEKMNIDPYWTDLYYKNILRNKESSIKLTQLGNGGAFDTDIVNTSFVINNHILVDCGYNVFPHLKNNKPDVLASIDTVVITHFHSDHAGSLEALIYYKRFVMKQDINLVFVNDQHLEDYKKYFSSVDTSYWGGKLKTGYLNKILHNIKYVDNILTDDIDGDMTIDYVYGTEHKVMNNVSYFFYNKTSKELVIISGDTRANKQIEIKSKEYDTDKITVYHDLSLNDFPDNIHMTKSDMQKNYSKDFIEKFIFVHTGQ